MNSYSNHIVSDEQQLVLDELFVLNFWHLTTKNKHMNLKLKADSCKADSDNCLDWTYEGEHC